VATSMGEEWVTGAIIGFSYSSSGLMAYFGLRLEYHDYVHALEEQLADL
jgi:hypothetical protein